MKTVLHNGAEELEMKYATKFHVLQSCFGPEGLVHFRYHRLFSIKGLLSKLFSFHLVGQIKQKLSVLTGLQLYYISMKLFKQGTEKNVVILLSIINK